MWDWLKRIITPPKEIRKIFTPPAPIREFFGITDKKLASQITFAGSLAAAAAVTAFAVAPAVSAGIGEWSGGVYSVFAPAAKGTAVAATLAGHSGVAAGAALKTTMEIAGVAAGIQSLTNPVKNQTREVIEYQAPYTSQPPINISYNYFTPSNPSANLPVSSGGVIYSPNYGGATGIRVQEANLSTNPVFRALATPFI